MWIGIRFLVAFQLCLDLPKKSNSFLPIYLNTIKQLIPLHINISITKRDVCFPCGSGVALSWRQSILDSLEGRKAIKGESSSWRLRLLLTDAATCFLACRMFVGNCLAMWKKCLSAFWCQSETRIHNNNSNNKNSAESVCWSWMWQCFNCAILDYVDDCVCSWPCFFLFSQIHCC